MTPQIVTLRGSGTMLEATPLSCGVLTLDRLRPRGKWKPLLQMTTDEARALAACLTEAANETDRQRLTTVIDRASQETIT